MIIMTILGRYFCIYIGDLFQLSAHQRSTIDENVGEGSAVSINSVTYSKLILCNSNEINMRKTILSHCSFDKSEKNLYKKPPALSCG